MNSLLIIFLGLILFFLGIVCGITIICALIVSGRISGRIEPCDEYKNGDEDEKSI